MADSSNPNHERRVTDLNALGREELPAQMRPNGTIANECSWQKLGTITEGIGERHSMGAIDDYISDDESVIVNSTENDYISDDESVIVKSTESSLKEGDRLSDGSCRNSRTADLGFALAKKQIMEGTDSSFAQLFQTWGTYLSDHNSDQVATLSMLQELDFCGPRRLPMSQTTEAERELLEPIVLKHTHSTPLRHTPSILNEEGEDESQPVGLEILERSRSTPLSTSANSAFGTKLRTVPYLDSPDSRSAFSLPPYRLRSTKSMQLATSDITFNPIPDAMELDSELISIEVMAMPSTGQEDQGPIVGDSATWKEKSFSLVSKFVSDLRSLGKKRRNRGGRENPARPPSSSDESSRKVGDVVYEDTTLSDSPHTNGSGAVGSCTRTAIADSGARQGQEKSMPHNPKHNNSNFTSQEGHHEAQAPTAEPSVMYHELDDDHQKTEVGRVRIQVSSRSKESLRRDDIARNATVPSPVPSQDSLNSSLQPTDNSPGRSRSSGTTQTSGQATQRTVTTNSSGQMSHLSSISETDREVMEANKGGTSEETSSSSPDQVLPCIALSSARAARYGYASFEGSPHILRDGANVPADRFFTFADSEARGTSRMDNSSSARKAPSRSPTTLSSSSTNTQSSTSTFGEEPPIFVSYLDRKTVSDLTTSRLETSSPRAGEGGIEQRESSPSEILLYSDMNDEESSALKTVISKKPRAMRPSREVSYSRQRVRSRPPRSPMKGGTRGTPSPNSSISPVGLYGAPGNDHFRRILDEAVDQG